MIYYTADLHLGHENVIRHCARPFSSAEEMDETLIRHWNARVHRNDTIYIVGDFFFRNRKPAEEYLDALKGKKHLIIGNHDLSWMRKAPSPDYWMKYFESVSPMSSIRDSGALVTLCHYPMMSWQGSGRGGYMVFGHIHNNTNASFWPLIRGSPLMLNAGVDINGFKPATLSELKNNNEIFKLSRPDIPCERAGNPENNEDGDEYE